MNLSSGISGQKHVKDNRLVAVRESQPDKHSRVQYLLINRYYSALKILRNLVFRLRQCLLEFQITVLRSRLGRLSPGRPKWFLKDS